MAPTNNKVNSKRVAILIENQFEDSEFQIAFTALRKAGAIVTVLGSRMNEEYLGKRGKVTLKPDATATEARSEDFDALIILGGRIRTNPNVVRLVIETMAQGKLVAAVDHGPQVLIEAGQLRGKQATGYRAIHKDIQNAGATYIDGPVAADGALITARQASDMPIFMTTILRYLGLTIEGATWPETSDRTFEWWKLGEAWGGSSRQEIVKALNTAIVGERYTLEAFRQYGYRVRDNKLRLALEQISAIKQDHVELLEIRLRQAFHEQVTWQAVGGEMIAALNSWLQSSDDMAILRRALGDIQTGVVDAYHLCRQLTDPLTVAILDKIESDLAKHEQRLATLYRERSGKSIPPPMPTTIAAVN